jgi:hypothetical protein
MDAVQIDITTQCQHKCSNCTRLMAHQPRREDMRLDQFERAVKSMEGWQRPGRLLGVSGGEPTLHGEFERLSHRFAELWGGLPTPNGKLPIKNLNQFATERSLDRSTGRGLWTSLGDGFYRHYETIMEVYGYWNTNTHETGGRHQTVLVSREDYKKANGISDEQWLQNRDNCPAQSLWSASINDKGAYFCEVAAAIDRLYFDGAHAWGLEQGWWQRTPADFGSQLDLCNFCSLAQPGPAQLDILERDIVSRENRSKLHSAGSPALKNGDVENFDPELHLEKKLATTQDNFIGEKRRVGIGHRSIRPRKLSCVVVSVNYADRMAQTLPRNIGMFDEFVIVTTSGDTETQALARMHGATLVISDRCFDDDHSFNKGRMLNDGLVALTDPDWVLMTDADITLNPQTRNFILSHALNPGCMYYTSRENCTHVENERGTVNAEPNGYFQLFHPSARAIRNTWPKPLSEAFCSAGSIDSYFWQQWPLEKLVFIPELGVQHLACNRLGENWNGTQAEARKGKWVQLGILTVRGFTFLERLEAVPDRIKLTDTQYGESLIIDSQTVDDHVRVGPNGLIFLGHELGNSHIHVAFKT